MNTNKLEEKEEMGKFRKSTVYTRIAFIYGIANIVLLTLYIST